MGNNHYQRKEEESKRMYYLGEDICEAAKLWSCSAQENFVSAEAVSLQADLNVL